jgi:hypothetical protein
MPPFYVWCPIMTDLLYIILVHNKNILADPDYYRVIWEVYQKIHKSEVPISIFKDHSR